MLSPVRVPSNPLTYFMGHLFSFFLHFSYCSFKKPPEETILTPWFFLRFLRCLSAEMIYSALASIAHSRNLLSAGSSLITLNLLEGVTIFIFFLALNKESSSSASFFSILNRGIMSKYSFRIASDTQRVIFPFFQSSTTVRDLPSHKLAMKILVSITTLNYHSPERRLHQKQKTHFLYLKKWVHPQITLAATLPFQINI